MVVKYRSAPVSKLYAMTLRLYQCSSALLPAAEYRTSAIGPVRSGQDHRVPDLLDPVEDLVAGLEEVLLDADVRVHRFALAAVRQVGAGRPHEVAAEAVDVVRELDVVERVRDPELVPDLRLGSLRRARVDVADAAVGRADVAVEDRRKRVVAVQVDAPRVARRGVEGRVRRRAVRAASAASRSSPRMGCRSPRRRRRSGWSCCAAAGEVVRRVVRAVRVRRRKDEDVEVVDEVPRPPVERVVVEQLRGGLQAGQRRRPLTGVLLAVQEDADLPAGVPATVLPLALAPSTSPCPCSSC